VRQRLAYPAPPAANVDYVSYPLAAGAVFGLSVGTACGVVPARRAASLDPIVALRHD
jgi:ABC-type antimicrobial peptide transport system permease subunit